MRTLEPLGEEVQLGFPQTERFQRRDRCDDIVAVGAGVAVTLTHVMELLLEREPPGILRMAAIDHVAERAHRALGLALEPHAPFTLAVNRGDLLALAQIRDRL